MSKIGIILHSVIQADDCIRNNLHVGNLLFSTHYSVNVYLRERYFIACQSLSKLWNTDEVIACKNTASQRVDKILQALDSQIAPLINDELRVQMRYFVPLYSYLGKFCYCSYCFLLDSIGKIIEAYNLDQIIIYNNKSNGFFANATDLKTLLPFFFEDKKIKVIDFPSVSSDKLQKTKQLLNIIIKTPIFILDKVTDLFYREIRPRLKVLDNKKTNILLIEHLYNLSFLKITLSQYNVFHFLPKKKDSFWGKRDLLLGGGWKNIFSANPQPHLAIPSHLFDIPLTDNLDRIFATDIKEDFLTNVNQYLKDLGSLKSFQGKWPVSLAIWGNSPITGLKALVVEYLRSEGICILGGQHGAVFGDAYEPWHFDSDFNRCDFYLSYGFTGKDLRKLYPGKDIHTTIVPLGVSMENSGSKHKTPVDVLFPLTLSLSLFDGGMVRELPDRLAEAQIALLKYLDSLTDLDIYIKPFMFSNDHNSAVIPILQRMKRVKVIDYMPLKYFLSRYHPKIILIEQYSTPLYESLHLDSEIFLMDNPVIPFDNKALEKLQKRVHYCHDVAEMIAKIDLYFKGGLKKKRDQSFYRHYIFKNNTQGNILSLIDKLVRRIDPPTREDFDLR